MIFVVATPGAEMDLDRRLEGGLAEIAGWHFERCKLIGERDIVTEANWKLALDTYTENYHFQVLHAEAFGPIKVPNVAHHWRWGQDLRNWSLAWPSKSITGLHAVPESEWGDVHEHFSIMHYIFPNTVIAIYPDTCNVMQVYPGGSVGEQRTRMRFFSRTAEPTAQQEALIAGRFENFYHVLQNEDYLMVKTAFRNIATGLLPTIVVGRNEPALGWIHEGLEQAVPSNHIRHVM